MIDDPRMRTARHEAAHAVAAHFEKIKVLELRLDPDGGECFVEIPAEQLQRGRRFDDIALAYSIYSIAGEAAVPGTLSHSDQDGFERSALWLGGFAGDLFALRETFTEFAREILDAHADAVDRVAEELLRRGVLSGDEFRALYEACVS